ncbi:MAG: Exonuclease [Candidatus Parcubacteria bacterium]|jgi:DNA polymerase III epsilon subunit-like protein
MKKGVYLGIDAEFTGQHPHKNALIELAMIVLDKDLKEIAHYQTLVQVPEGFEITDEAMRINKLDLDKVEAEGVSYDKLVQQITKFVKKHFENKPILFAHFITMDFAYLNYIFGSVDKDNLFWKEIIGHNVIDTKVLSNTINLLQVNKGKEPIFKSTSLSNPGGLTDTLGITDYEAHTALGDIRATKEVMVKLLAILDTV